MLLLLIAFMAFVGCASLEVAKTKNALKRLTGGMHEEKVRSIVGEPQMRFDFSPGKFVYYYQIRERSAANVEYDEIYTPISFEDHKLIALGQDLRPAWQAMQKEGKRSEILGISDVKIGADSAGGLEKVDDPMSSSEAQRRNKIEQLEKKVRPIPASNTALNLDLYQQLLLLDPDNKRYQRKVAHYQSKLEKEMKNRKDSNYNPIVLNQKLKDMSTKQELTLRQKRIDGFNNFRISLHTVKPGAYYLWIKNIGEEAITLKSNQFSLENSDKKPVKCYPADELITTLEPGETIHGTLSFSEQAIPSLFILNHKNAGRVAVPIE